ncbi:MAG: nuclear transport factor 2 family protein [Planctomycetota bacterium]|nr:nuclear transport factor 2 family protein [Planctomycetota bacterium]
MSQEIEAVRQTIAAINRRDPAGVVATLARDVAFVDAHGRRFEGRETLMEGWRGYFTTFPDYQLEIDKEQAVAGGVLVLGHAVGSYRGRPDRAWRIPIAIRAEVREGKVALWQVFADTHLPFESMRA